MKLTNRVGHGRSEFQSAFTQEGRIIAQATLNKWLPQTKLSSVREAEYEGGYIEIPRTISCIELAMKHDKRGYVIGWMEGEPKADEWDGSTDNREKILEDHVSKYGWAF